MSAAAVALPQGRSSVRRLIADYGQELVVFLSIVVLFIIVGAYNPRFLSDTNINSIFAGNAYIAIAAIGMSLVIISGHIDVSIGSLVGVIATIAGTLAVNGYPIWIAWTLPILFAVAVNTAVGTLVAYTKIPSIVVTLGMLSILKGGLISATGGEWITNMPPAFMLAQYRPFGIPSAVYFMVFLTAIAAFAMRYTSFGRSIYAVGGNAEAARAAGLNPERTVVGVFALHGFFAGIAGLLFATQLQVIQSTVPPNLELTVITASVIGGVSILGGTGTVIGSTLAAILFAAINSALVFLNISAYWLRAVLGLMILATVLADMIRRRRAS
jgi:ribose/xylose/arabinose/galactoside ABC-type transport system permease subunit